MTTTIDLTTVDLTPIFQAIIALLAALITCKVIPWIKAKTTNEQQTMLWATVRTLVFAAEQIYGAGQGAVKLAYVEGALEQRGFKVDTADIEAMVRECAAELHATITKPEKTEPPEQVEQEEPADDLPPAVDVTD